VVLNDVALWKRDLGYIGSQPLDVSSVQVAKKVHLGKYARPVIITNATDFRGVAGRPQLGVRVNPVDWRYLLPYR
jgi:hypothetical protein